MLPCQQASHSVCKGSATELAPWVCHFCLSPLCLSLSSLLSLSLSLGLWHAHTRFPPAGPSGLCGRPSRDSDRQSTQAQTITAPLPPPHLHGRSPQLDRAFGLLPGSCLSLAPRSVPACTVGSGSHTLAQQASALRPSVTQSLRSPGGQSRLFLAQPSPTPPVAVCTTRQSDRRTGPTLCTHITYSIQGVAGVLRAGSRRRPVPSGW